MAAEDSSSSLSSLSSNRSSSSSLFSSSSSSLVSSAGASATYDLAPGTNAGAPGAIYRIVYDWVSDADGDATITTSKISGELIKGITVPDAAPGAPTDDYDIVITDEQGVNVLAQSQDDLTDRDEANTEEVYFMITIGQVTYCVYPVVDDKLTITVSNAGAYNGGTLYLYFRP